MFLILKNFLGKSMLLISALPITLYLYQYWRHKHIYVCSWVQEPILRQLNYTTMNQPDNITDVAFSLLRDMSPFLHYADENIIYDVSYEFTPHECHVDMWHWLTLTFGGRWVPPWSLRCDSRPWGLLFDVYLGPVFDTWPVRNVSTQGPTRHQPACQVGPVTNVVMKSCHYTLGVSLCRTSNTSHTQYLNF